jgi:hypothetical protein
MASPRLSSLPGKELNFLIGERNRMLATLDLKHFVDDIGFIYHTQIENMDSLIETTQLILNEFQEPLQPLLKTKQIREEINNQLKDLLSQNEHLRRKDFDRMMQSILYAQIEKEKDIRYLVNCYLTEQKVMINLLRDHLTKIKDAIAKGKAVVAQESQNTLTQILIQQDKGKQEVTSKLKEFQKEQHEMTDGLLELLAKGRELRIKDLKSMLMEFKTTSHKERLVCRKERKVEVQKRREAVHDMLVDCKKKRVGFAQRRIKSPEVNPPVRNITKNVSDNKKKGRNIKIAP